jgi:hypothetical protein
VILSDLVKGAALRVESSTSEIRRMRSDLQKIFIFSQISALQGSARSIDDSFPFANKTLPAK